MGMKVKQTGTTLLLSLLIPDITSLVSVQILTLKHTLCKLSTLPSQVQEDVSIAMLKYMHFLEFPENSLLLQSILQELTLRELEDLQNLVQSASEHVKTLELEKYITLYKELEKDPFDIYMPTITITNNTGV